MTIGFLLQSTRVLEGGIYDEEDLRMIYGYVIHIDDEILNDYYNTCTIFSYDNDLELYIEIIDALIVIFEEREEYEKCEILIKIKEQANKIINKKTI
jgi:hypothetical protein